MDRASIPVTMGLTAPIRANVGEASGTGTDISLDYKQTFMNGFWLTAMGNFTYATSEYRVYEEPNYDEPWRYRVGRSEEHTSELQSLMRISYAVFCLKKKKK